MSDVGLVDVWRTRLAGCTAGEFSVPQWCERECVSVSQYYCWRRRIAAVGSGHALEKGNASANAQPWLAVDVFGSPQAVATSGGVTVRIGRAVIELQPGFDPSVLRAGGAAMLSNFDGVSVYLACGNTDMRKSIDGLAAIVQYSFDLRPFGPSLFVFCNRGRDKLKILTWDHNGVWL